MKLIEDWKRAHRKWSVQLSGVLAMVAGADWLLPNVQGVIPRWAYFALAVAIFGARLIQQEKK